MQNLGEVEVKKLTLLCVRAISAPVSVSKSPFVYFPVRLSTIRTRSAFRKHDVKPQRSARDCWSRCEFAELQFQPSADAGPPAKHAAE